MPSNIIKYKIIVSSPKDIIEEHSVIDEVIEEWNTANSDYYGAILEKVSWKTHTTPEIGDRPQAIITKQLELKDCDVLVAIFWTRLGTHTGKAESGTVEEIEDFIYNKKPVSIYFSLIDIPQEILDIEQYQSLSKIKNKYEKEGLIVNYKSINDFRDKFRHDLTKKINSIHREPINVTNKSGVSQRAAKISAFEKPILKEPIRRSIIPFVSGSGGGGGKGLLNTIALKTINPRVFDERKQPPIGSSHLPLYKWDVQNFGGFFYDLKDDLGKESLQVLQPNLGANNRTIGKGKLIYSTTAEPKKLKVVEEAFGNNVTDAITAGLEQTAHGKGFENGQYWIIGWITEGYVALNGKVDKLAKLIIEQGTDPSEKKTLTVGESWDIGDGWTITANSIDSRATPKQVWLTLSKDGIKKDDKVVSEKKIYTYVEKRIADETDVPVFVTYVDSVFPSATTDMVQLRYTWLISESVTKISSSDTYGVFKNANVNNKNITMYNDDNSISLTRDTTVNLMGDLKFKVADRADVLRFYPTVLP